MAFSIFGSLDTGRRALRSHQIVLDTVGHNLANAMTPGYSRQRADLTSINPRDGVDVSGVRRIRDRFLDFQLLNETQTLGREDSQHLLMQRLESIFNESEGTGLGTMMDRFTQSLQDLSVHPSDQAVRVTVKDTAESLVQSFHGLRDDIDQLKADLRTEIQNRVNEANSLLQEIAEIHQRIGNVSAEPGTPNDLLDHRDQLITQLSEIIGVAATDRTNDTVQLALAGSGVLLVDGTRVATLTATTNMGTDTVDLTAGGLAITPASGRLAALVNARNNATGPVKQASTDLDTLARAIMDEVNLLHASGSGITEHTSLTAANAVSNPAGAINAVGLVPPPIDGSFRVVVHSINGTVLTDFTVPITAGTTTLNDIRAAIDADPNLTAAITSNKLVITAAAGAKFTFGADSSGTLRALGVNTFFTGTDAFTMAVNPVVASDVSKIAAAKADAAGLVHAGDGSNALDISRLRTKLTMNGGTDTFSGFHATLVSRVGSQTRDASQALERQQGALNLVQNLQQQTSGVSMDEELVTLTQHQNAYAASARYITTLTEVLDTLLAMGR